MHMTYDIRHMSYKKWQIGIAEQIAAHPENEEDDKSTTNETSTSTSTWDIRKKCLSVITAIFWEVKYDRTFSCACAFSQPSQRLGALTVRRSCLRESCLSKSKCCAWCLSKSICSTWCLKISKILVQILHAVLNSKVDMSLMLKLKV